MPKIRGETGATASGAGGVTDHGALTGLADDDHTQYSRADGTRAYTDYIDIEEHATPGNPPADTLRLFVEDFHGFPFYSFRDSTGMERKIVRDSVFVGKNISGGPIGAMSLVYASGSEDNVPTIAKAKADDPSTMPCIGVVLETIANGAFGRILQVGLIEGINTNAFNEGDVIYVSATVAGGATATAPLHPNIRQEVATILVKDVATGAAQVVIRSMVNEGIIDHGGLLGLADDDHAQYHNDARGDARYTPIAERVTNGNTHDHSGGDGNQIDHGGLGGIGDDDHTQYMPSDGTIRDETGCHLMKYSDTGIDNTLDTIVANGANDVTSILSYDATISESAGGVAHSTGNLTPGNNSIIYNDGVDALTLSVAADGSVTIQRTAGAATFDVLVDLRWI